MDEFIVQSNGTQHVSLHRPLSRYGIVICGCLIGWWCYQAGQPQLAVLAFLWGVSEF